MNPGDLVECVDAEAVPNITKGKTYAVRLNKDIQLSDSIFVVNDKNEEVRYLKRRFRVSAQNFIKVDGPTVTFKLQDGPIKEVGVNGCQIDDVIGFARDKIAEFQAKIPCTENGHAVTKLDESLMWLEQRKKNREKRAVEGTSKA